MIKMLVEWILNLISSSANIRISTVQCDNWRNNHCPMPRESRNCQEYNNDGLASTGCDIDCFASELKLGLIRGRRRNPTTRLAPCTNAVCSGLEIFEFELTVGIDFDNLQSVHFENRCWNTLSVAAVACFSSPLESTTTRK